MLPFGKAIVTIANIIAVFPNADIPVVQLSLRKDFDPEAHLAVGKALASLREDGILIIGSGMSFHNMRGYGDPHFTQPSEVFDQWLTETIESVPQQRWDKLVYWSQAPHAKDCHPMGSQEHLIPLMVAVGAAGDDAGYKVYSENILKTRLSAFRFG